MKPIFFPLASTLTLGEAALIAGSVLPDLADPERLLSGVAPLETAGPDELAYMDNPRYLDALGATRAGACLVGPRFVDRVPHTTATLVTPDPYRAYARVLTRLHPAALRPGTGFGASGVSGEAIVHPTALVAPDAVIDPAAVIGPHAEIGAGTVIGAHAVVGPLVRIGRDCSLGPGTSVLNAVIGDRVILHPGARLGQDGFGYAMGAEGHMKVPQVGCVLVEDDVEIGANTTVDRGGTRDTVIGEGTKIDNLVQIAHNVVIGRRCVIVAQVGIAGSTVLEDFVVVGGQSAIAGHLRIGRGAQIAAASGVMHDVPAGGRWGGAPAKPVATWFRELTTLKALAARRG